MSLYDPTEPEKSIDLLVESMMETHRIKYCHFFMECGKKSTRETLLNGKKITVCDDHFDEIEQR